MFNQNWSEAESKESSAFRELKQFLCPLLPLQKVSNHILCHGSQNSNVVSIVSKGFKVP